jgi:pyruvate/2-oxoglutarate dehydrogenase complex dihydrolipoamide acyltransferase (E2) component
MSKVTGYHVLPFTDNRRMVSAAASISNEQSTIHGITEIDITAPRTLIREHLERTGQKLSFTAFVAASMARAVAENPEVNSFRRGRKLIRLDDLTLSVLIERNLAGEAVPEPLAIHTAQSKTFMQIHDEIRSAQTTAGDKLGSLAETTWTRFVPGILLRLFVRLASRSIYMAKRFGKVAVTAVGMFGNNALWFVPMGGGTVVATVGSIVERPVLRKRRIEAHEFLCLTLSFNHEIIDGAPAARFVKRLAELIEHGDVLLEVVSAAADDKKRK